MFILHISEYCHVLSVGGTERYIQDLINELHRLGVRNAIGWLTGSGRGDSVADGIEVFSLPAPQMRIDEPAVELQRRAVELLEKVKPDVVHFHTFGRSEALIAGLASHLGIPYVFTYHSPAWSCRRGDLLLWGRELCDGEVRPIRCSVCKLHQRLPLPVPFLYGLAHASRPVGKVLSSRLTSDHRRRIAFVQDTAAYQRALQEFLGGCSRAILCCEWSVPVLAVNGANADTIRVCPQGVSTRLYSHGNGVEPDDEPGEQNPFTIGYVGRMTPVKGVDLLVRAFRRMPATNICLKLIGWPAGEQSEPFLTRIQHEVEADPRIQRLPKLTHTELAREYRRLHLLAIPSVWPETGPLVLLEALQCGVPVYGSERIGQLELLKTRGSVVSPNTVAAWRHALDSAHQDFLQGKWRAYRIRAQSRDAVRDMTDVAREMRDHYETLCHA